MEKTSKLRDNRRGSIRRKAKRSTKAACTTGKFGLGATVSAAVLDISETGVRLRVQSEQALGQEIDLQLSSICWARPIRAIGEVVWCLQTAEKDYCIGVHFRRPLAYRDLLSL